MKHYLCLLMVICSSISFAQNNTTNDYLEFDTNFRIQTFHPIHFGNTALSKAHKPRPGFSVQMNLLDYHNVKVGFGVDFVTYDITDKEIIANLSTSKYSSSYLLISYEHALTDKILITPNLGYGSASLHLGSRNSRFGEQSGTEFRIGAMIDYRIGETIFIFGGINYVNNKFDIETAPEYESFFSKANQIQLNLGIRFGN